MLLCVTVLEGPAVQFIWDLLGIGTIAYLGLFAVALSVALFLIGPLVRRIFGLAHTSPRMRLLIVEKARLSASRDAIILKCDAHEYLLLTGDQSDTVLELQGAEVSERVDARPQVPTHALRSASPRTVLVTRTAPARPSPDKSGTSRFSITR